MKKKTSVAASVFKQAKTRLESASTVIRLGEADSQLRTYVDDRPDPNTGAPRLCVVIPGKKKPEKYDLSRLLVQPEMAALLAEGFRCWAPGVGTRSRQNYRYNFNTHVADFLTTISGNIDPVSVDEAFWTAFLRWLNAPRLQEQPWAPQTRAIILGAVRVCIEALLDHDQYGPAAAHLLDRSGLPHNPWPGRSTKQMPTRVLTPSEKDQLVLACLGEVAAVSQHLRDREEILAIGCNRLEEARSAGLAIPYADVGVCAALISESFPDRLASLDDCRIIDCRLASAVHHNHGMARIRRLLYSTFRDLVPFVLLLGMRTAFNADTLLTLTWSNVRTSFDGRRITFVGVKGRATQGQASSDDATDVPDEDQDEGENQSSDLPAEVGVPGGLADLLDILRRLTERTREILTDRDHADRLFLGVPIRSGSVPKAFSQPSGPAADITWKYALEAFIKDHRVKPFTLKMLRTTEGEEEYRQTGDLLAIKRRLGHKQASTVRTHYTSDWVRLQGQDRIGETQDLLVRWVGTEGHVDPRGRPRWEHAAATSGFLCLDPYDSPRLGQQKGRLCTAYGECPACPLSAARPRDPKAVALYFALRSAMYAGQQGRIPAKGWLEKWAHILTDLNALLAEIPPETAAQAARYRVVLKPVG